MTCCGLPLVDDLPLGWKPPRFAWALLALSVALGLIAPWPGIALPWLGLPLAALGVAAAVGAKRQFKRERTPVCPTLTPTRLVDGGWFGLSRNPMYVGLVLVLAGAGLSAGSALALLPAVAYAVLLARCYVPREERQMDELFGAEWQAYATRVRRWV